MKKTNITWTIKGLINKSAKIEFPEFQREPTVWNIDSRRKLIDSILRKFDIASIYLYKREDGYYDCIDGRQRINTIYSFVSINEPSETIGDNNDYHNNFKFISDDELLGSDKLKHYNNKIWQKFNPKQREEILNYKLNVLEIEDIDDENELNLMFLRLQLGQRLNAGEKLNAMVGDMKDFIFRGNNPLGNHKYFKLLMITKRRFSIQLTAAQVAINFFSQKQKKEFSKARFVDLQEFFKSYLEFNEEQKEISKLLRKRLDTVYNSLKDSKIELKNRAIGVTTFFFINSLIEKKQDDKIEDFVEFLKLFLKRYNEQIPKGLDIDKNYRRLVNFQTYVTQAAVEKYAIRNRQKFLEEYFEYYLDNGKIKGDE